MMSIAEMMMMSEFDQLRNVASWEQTYHETQLINRVTVEEYGYLTYIDGLDYVAEITLITGLGINAWARNSRAEVEVMAVYGHQDVSKALGEIANTLANKLEAPRDMTFDEYRELSEKFVQESVKGKHEYFLLGLTGAIGEIADLLKKEMSDGVDNSHGIKLALGDALFYIVRLLREYDWEWINDDFLNLFLASYARGDGGRELRNIVSDIHYAIQEERYPELITRLHTLFFHRFPDATQADWIGLMQANLNKLTERYGGLIMELTIDDYKSALRVIGITDDAIKDFKNYGYLEDLFNSAINAGGFMIGETIGFTDEDGVAGVGNTSGEDVTVIQLRSTLVIYELSCEFVLTSVLTSDYDVIPVDELIKTLEETNFYERLERRNMKDDGDE